MKKIKIFSVIILIVAVSAACSLCAQRSMHDNSGFDGKGRHAGYHLHIGSYNHNGWGARPYYGVATVPFGYGYYGNNCGYVGYWHQWRCW